MSLLNIVSKIRPASAFAAAPAIAATSMRFQRSPADSASDVARKASEKLGEGMGTEVRPPQSLRRQYAELSEHQTGQMLKDKTRQMGETISETIGDYLWARGYPASRLKVF
jgi:uncharacterized membrane-anchored protein YjiN (DUF445 family)